MNTQQILRRASTISKPIVQQACLLLLAFSLGFDLPPILSADEVRIVQPAKDNTVYSESDSKSSALARGLYVGKTSGRIETDTRRSLLAFNLERSVPEGASVQSVTLTLTATQPRLSVDETDVNIALHRVQNDWGENESFPFTEGGMGAVATPNDATWTHRFFETAQTWATPGGDFMPEASASLDVGGFGEYEFNSPTLADDVQLWVDDPGSNFGWIIIGEEQVGGRTKMFQSKEGFFQAERPKLTIIFSTAPAIQNPFADLDDLGDGWRQSPFLGLLNDSFFPWIFHLQHNWLFVAYRPEQDDLFLFDPAAGSWWYTNDRTYPSLFSFARNAWVFYFVDTGAPRQFVDLQSEAFFDLP